jgi:hypothetical protein
MQVSSREHFDKDSSAEKYQFDKSFFKRSMVSGGWLVTSFDKSCSSSPPIGSNS